MPMKTILALFLLSFSLASNGHEYLEYFGKVTKWKDPNITWHSSLSAENTEIARNCFKQWSDATDGFLKFTEVAEADAQILVFSQPLNSYVGLMRPHGFYEIGFFYKTDAILDSAILLDPYKVKSILLHEIGHCLGVGHNNNVPNGIDLPTMFTVQTVYPVMDTLHLEDINAVRTLYGLPERVPEPLIIYVTKIRHRTFSLMVSDADGGVQFVADKKRGRFEKIVTTNLGQTSIGNPVVIKMSKAWTEVKAYWNGRSGTIILGKKPKSKGK